MSDHESPLLLSVVIIAEDDPAALCLTLDIAEAVADEILVIGEGGDRSSLNAAATRGAIVASSEESDEAAVRNDCLAKARGQWVLWLEAGESLTATEARALRSMVEHRADRDCAYRMLICAPPVSGGLAGEQISQVRLAPHRGDVRFAGRVCASMEQALGAAGLRIESLPHCILRGQREHDCDRKSQRAKRGLRAAETALAAEGEHAAWLNAAAEARQVLGDRRQAAELHRQAILAAEPGSREMLEAYYGLLTALDGSEQNVDAQLSVCVEALTRFPNDMQLLCAMGGYLQAQRRSHLAAQAFHVAYTQGVVNPEVWHLQDARGVAAICYSRLLEDQDKQEAAAAFLAAAAQELPESVLVRRQLMEWRLRNGHTDAALALLDDMPLPLPERTALRHAVIGSCLARRECWSSAISYLHRAFQADCRDPLCLRWLAAALLATNKLQEARIVLAEWVRTDPDCAEAKSLLETVQSRLASSHHETRDRRIDEPHGAHILPSSTLPTIVGATSSVANYQSR